ncbi:hypothetical protein FIBSPDRAFT_959476 [Athelia psychrophila]|uniref:Uncharacterized protein n=1 Tax=Athelia psychrophila TaxID=1759441 RepID=A0A166DFS6_9AGAM|nr:hypothetical protein FIBSPDRAFT_959476 [Fibularhizoctonia sp. CBS 109695]
MSSPRSEAFTSSTCGVINDRLWVSPISSTLDRLNSNSWELKNPLQKFTGFSDHGIPLGIDWSLQPAYYDLDVHWRGYLPVDATPEHEWETSAVHVSRSGTNGYVVDESIAVWRKAKTDRLRKEVDELAFMLDFESNQVPFPRIVDTLPITFLHPMQAGVFRSMAVSRSYYLDLIAFYCWVYRVFNVAIENHAWDEYYPPSKEMLRWRGLQDVVGYLLDFSEQWKVHGAPMWMDHDVPFHYVWHEGLAANDRFRRWDPAKLNAYNESTNDQYTEGAEPITDPLSSEDLSYDDWLQVQWPRSENNPVTVTSCPYLPVIRPTHSIRFHIVPHPSTSFHRILFYHGLTSPTTRADVAPRSSAQPSRVACLSTRRPLSTDLYIHIYDSPGPLLSYTLTLRAPDHQYD